MKRILTLTIVFLLTTPIFVGLLPKVQAEDYTFGKTDIGSRTTGLGPNFISGSKFALAETGTVTKMSVYIGSYCYGSGNSKCAIYDAGGDGKPGNLKVESAELTSLTLNAWNIFTVSPGVELSAGDYWLLFWSQRNPELCYDAGAANVGLQTLRTYGEWPDPWNLSPYYTTNEFSIYATYTLPGPRIIYVDPKNVGDPLEDGSPAHPFDKIQEGINAASAGDTVFVYNGTCYENVVLNKTVSLIGENRGTTIIDGNGTGTVVLVRADDVVIKNLTIRNGYSGIKGESCRNSIISGNKITNNGVGVGLHFSYGGDIINQNNITNNGEMGVNIFGHEIGGAHTRIFDNRITGNNGSGMSISSSSVSVSRNSITGNNDQGVCISTDSYGNVSKNNIEGNGADGILLTSSKVNISRNSITNNTGYGIAYSGGFYTGGLHTSGNTITDNGRGGIYVFPSVYWRHNTIFNNTIAINDGYGIHLYLSSSYLNISANIMANNNYGIFLSDSNNMALVNNTLANNTAYGIYLYSSNNNTITGNSFRNNTVQAYANQSYNNSWNNSYLLGGGNYWSDYTGRDLHHGPFQDIPGSDGIGDTPYVIDSNNTDHYPLMGVGWPPSSPTVLSPNGGELWSGAQIITWSASTDPDGDPVTYDIEYSMNAGAGWETLATGISETSYTWDTTLLPDSNNYLVRVRAYDGVQCSGWDECDDIFAVDNTLPVVEIVHPTEGQVVTGDTVWVNGTVTELNKGALQPSIDDARFSLVEWNGTYFAFKNISIIAEGPISVTVSFTDLVGNIGSDTVSFSYSTAVSDTELSVSVTPSSALVGYEVEIVGRLTWQENGTSITDAPILVSYQYHPDLMSYIPAEQSWNIISTVTTATDGSYSAAWFVMSSGIYRIEVFYPGSGQASSATSTAYLLIADLEEKIFSVLSNSTVSNMNFNSTTKEIEFTVSGPSGTTGYMDMFLAKSLVPDTSGLKIYFDGMEKSYESISVGDTWFVRLAYTHSSHTVRISLSQSLSPIISSELMILTIGITVIGSIIALLSLRKKRRKRAVPPSMQRQQLTL